MATGIENWKPLAFDEGDYFYFNGGYDSLVESWGYDTVAFATHGDYQGDYFYLLRDGEEYGFLNVGYGSCSGCDSLQACTGKAEVEELRSRLHSDIHWEGNKGRMAEWLISHDWPGCYYGEPEEVQKFIGECLSHLSVPELSMTTRSLLANPDCPVCIVADSVEEYGNERLARALRGEHTGPLTLKRLRQFVT